ncbi:MAG: nickel pincer cofactor biosynthesis protein LarC [Planctomycetota bacterium]|mgnify:CR=1 FL=1
MRVAWFDVYGGASGDMMLGALLDAGAPLAVVRGAVRGLGIRGLDVSVRRVRRGALGASKADVRIPPHGAHGHGHEHRGPAEIDRILRRARLESAVRALAREAFENLGDAEARVHRVPKARIHFHEVGSHDALADIVGSCAAFCALGIERAFVGPVPLGQGEVAAGHGRIPLPAPATLEILRSFPVRPGGAGETVTPTGAVLLATLGVPGGMPPMTLRTVGVGAGDRENPIRPNVLRVLVGDSLVPAGSFRQDEVCVLETQIDDASPQILGALFETALREGALDVFQAPVLMKKNRPGIHVTVISPPEKAEALAGLLFAETPTLGVRVRMSERWILEREFRTVRTRYGPVRVKIARTPSGVLLGASPEFESVRAAAVRRKAPLRAVWTAATAAADRDRA